MANQVYDQLKSYQGEKLKDINIRDIVDAVLEAGRNNDYENLPIVLKDDNNRLAEGILSFDYDVFAEEELIIVNNQGNSWEIPANNINGTNYREIENKVKSVLNKYEDQNIYIDMKYLEETLDNEKFEPYLNEEVKETMQETINQRTVIESNYEVQLDRVADALREQGYDVKKRNGASILVTDKNLSPENSITITKKNAYIERAELSSDETKNIYTAMKDAAITAMNNNFTLQQHKQELIESSPNLAGIPTQTICSDLMREFALNQNNGKEQKDVVEDPIAQYGFKDKDGNDYLTFSMGYHIDEENNSIPVIYASYGEKYGGANEFFTITEDDLTLSQKDDIYKSDIAKKLNEFAAIGLKDRDSIYKEVSIGLKTKDVEKYLDKEFKVKKFQKRKTTYVDFIMNATKDYYRKDIEKPLSEYIKDRLYDANILRKGMKSRDGLDQYFARVAKKVEEIATKTRVPDLSKLEINKVELDKLTYERKQDGQVIAGTNVREPIDTGREWLNKLANLEDKLIDLKNGPVEDFINTAKSMARGVNEARQGIVMGYKDGIFSGVEVGTGIKSFADGLSYGDVLYDLEKQYKELELAGEKDKDAKIAAIDKGIDIKLFRDDIMKNANVYTKAAIALKENVNKMLDYTRSLKRDSEAVIAANKGKASSVIKVYAEQTESVFKHYSQIIVDKFRELYNATLKLGNTIKDNVKDNGTKLISMGKNELNYIEAKAIETTNNFKEKFNDTMIEARGVLSYKEYSKNTLAQRINDARVETIFSGISPNEMEQYKNEKLYNELQKMVKSGKEAEKIPEKDRTEDDKKTIEKAKKAKSQIEQSDLIADRISTKVRELFKDNSITPEKATEILAKEYHKSAMAYRALNDEETKSYNSLTKAEQDMCKDMIKDVLDEMPGVSAKFERNLEKIGNEH